MEDIGNAIESQHGLGQRTVGISIPTFLASLGAAATIFSIEFVIFLLVRSKLTRVYQPRTYLVPERERIAQSPASVFRWIIPVFRTPKSEFIEKCGLDAYFFLRYLRMLLKIFIPLSLLLLPVLLTVDKVGGKDMNPTSSQNGAFVRYNVSGLDQLA
ncbi:hypothetical protein TESG_08223 [Trichophyton tonsurans CBS 112818]|uniref:CSC1/OSCA1-like N-terminal transmembrane domain-containing protein n=1 Tax=Trichophyton tonsurans (strain CBS 112818) TaxID=647933 RepID=F2SBI6_TRIT1|nr:hypothetical protein TESG_08223 [Trichophyton tonsurans CBS 112818]